MRIKWLINILLVLGVLALGAYVYIYPKQQQHAAAEYAISNYKISDFTQVRLEFPAQTALRFTRVDGFWYMNTPYRVRADQAAVRNIMAIVTASSPSKISDADLSKYGLTHITSRVVLSRADGQEEVFTFGGYNTVLEKRYVAHRGLIYLVPERFSEISRTPPIELIDKSPLKPGTQITAFDFSGLEQWQGSKLKLTRVDKTWRSSLAKTLPDDARALQEWLETYWQTAEASAVTFAPPANPANPWLVVTTDTGQGIRFEKLQESPELLLATQGLVYHFAQDIGFTMLNPPLKSRP